MSISEILSPECIQIDLKAACKRDVLSCMAQKAAQISGEDCENILETLIERERLGSTGVGDGVAIPHGKIEGLNRIVGVFTRLEEPVDFEALDNAPVDLCFLLLAPANATAAHLKALARVARLLRDPENRKALRQADTAETFFAIATTKRSSNAA